MTATPNASQASVPKIVMQNTPPLAEGPNWLPGFTNQNSCEAVVNRVEPEDMQICDKASPFRGSVNQAP